MYAHIDARIHTRKKTHSNVRMCKEEKKEKKNKSTILLITTLEAHRRAIKHEHTRTNEKITLNSARIKADDKREREKKKRERNQSRRRSQTFTSIFYIFQASFSPFLLSRFWRWCFRRRREDENREEKEEERRTKKQQQLGKKRRRRRKKSASSSPPDLVRSSSPRQSVCHVSLFSSFSEEFFFPIFN